MDIEHLIPRLKRNEQEAWTELAGLAADPLYAFAVSIVRDPGAAQDVAQKTLLSLFRNRAGLSKEGSLKGYTFRIATNFALQHFRVSKRRTQYEKEAADMRPEAPQTQALAEEAWELANELPEELRLPVLLRFGHGLTIRETAHALGVPDGTVSTRQRAGLQRLRDHLATTSLAAMPLGGLEALLGMDLAGPASITTPASIAASIQHSFAKGIAATSTPALKGLAMATTAKKSYWPVVLLLLLLLVGAGVGVTWPDWRADPEGTPTAASESCASAEHEQSSRHRDSGVADNAEETTTTDGVDEERQPAGTSGTDETAAPASFGEWELRGRLSFGENVAEPLRSVGDGSRMDTLLGGVVAVFTPSDGGREVRIPMDVARYGFSFEGQVDARVLGAGALGAWRIECDVWSAEASVQKSVSPTIAPPVVDFGDIEIGIEHFETEQAIAIGRLVHVSGRPLRNLAYVDLDLFFTPGWGDSTLVDSSSPFHADEEGRFAILVEESTPLEHTGHLELRVTYRVGRGMFRFDVDRPGMGREGVLETVTVPAPELRNGLLDFGDIVLDKGAHVEVLLEGMGPQLDRYFATLHNEFGSATGTSIPLTLSGGPSILDIGLQGRTTSVLLSEATYSWECDALSAVPAARASGTFLAREGMVQELVIKLEELPSLPLEIEWLGDPPTSCQISEYIRRAGADEWPLFGSGAHRISDGNRRVHVLPDGRTKVEVEADGYKDGTALVDSGTEKVAIRMAPGAPDMGRIRVELAGFPASMIGATGVVKAGWSNEEVFYCLEQAQALEFDVHEGTRSISVLGFAEFGFPEGEAWGPVELEITAGETTVVNVPELSPPWGQRIEGIACKVTAGDHPVSIHAAIEYEGGGVQLTRITDGDTLPYTGLAPRALLVGGKSVGLGFTLPEGGGEATLEARFEHNLEVKAKAQDQAVSSFKVTAVQEGESGMSCQADAIEGLARLWMAPGLTRVDIEVSGFTVGSRHVEVLPGGNLVIEVEIIELEVLCTDVRDADGPLWFLEKRSGDSWQRVHSIWASGTIPLEADNYRFLPWYGDEEDAIVVDLRTAGRHRIELPELKAPPALARVVFEYDANDLEGVTTESTVYFTTQQLQPGAAIEDVVFQDNYFDRGRLTQEGIELPDLPLGQDLLLLVTIRTSTGIFLVMPQRIQTPSIADAMSGEPVVRKTVKVLKAIWADFEWRKAWGEGGFNALLVGPGGIRAGMDQFWCDGRYIAPLGRWNIEFYSGDEHLFTEEVAIEVSENYWAFPVPESIRERLKELGVEVD